MKTEIPTIGRQPLNLCLYLRREVNWMEKVKCKTFRSGGESAKQLFPAKLF